VIQTVLDRVSHHNMLKNYLVKKNGFTLIELIIVIAILAVLTSVLIAIINPVKQLEKGRDGRRKSDIAQIQRALEIYYHDYGSYPTSTSDYKITANNGTTVNWGNSWLPYMEVVPSDPSSNLYVYYSPVSSSGQTYYLYASLELGTEDANACNNGNACSSLITNSITVNACGSTCNFGVSTPNVAP
jgi:general secretion pathway protein G